MISRRAWLGLVGGVAAAGLLGRRGAAASHDVFVFFVLNTQDFAYPDESARTVARVLDLHDALDVPLDVSLTTTMVDVFESEYPDLLRRLCTSRTACLAYHGRPPLPYHSDFDWLGLASMSAGQQRSTIYAYETHGLDLVTGQSTIAAGGYAKLASVAGYAPPSVGMLTRTGALQGAIDAVFAELGAALGAQHGRAANLGERRNGLYLRPEHVDLKLFEHVGGDGPAAVDEAVRAAPQAVGARPPYVVGIKMHDNDFFAEDSAWTTVYLARGARRGPPWDTSLRSPLLSADRRAAVWSLYEATVRHAASRRDTLVAVNSRHWQQALGLLATSAGSIGSTRRAEARSNRA